jgi:hypothetical protein
MAKSTREAGKLIRKIAKLDRAWRLAGKPEGRTENALAWNLGQAYRAGLGTAARRAQIRSAARLGQRSGWER